jgi:hypothetical protein
MFWTVLTIAFECLFGHYVMGLSWESILSVIMFPRALALVLIIPCSDRCLPRWQEIIFMPDNLLEIFGLSSISEVPLWLRRFL